MHKLSIAFITVVVAAAGCAADGGAAQRRATAELQQPSDEREVARAAEEKGSLEWEKTAFQARALTRLDMLTQKITNLRETARESKKPASLVDQCIVETSALRADVRSLEEKLPSIVLVSSEQTWDLTKNDLNGQINDLEARYLAANDLI